MHKKFKSHKKGFLLVFFSILFLSNNLKAQNLDLIITYVGDSIACRIDSITPSHIYFEMKYNYKWGPADLQTEEYSEYKLKVINLDNVTFKDGTSFIISYIDRGTPMVNDVYVPPKYQQRKVEEIIAAKPKELNKNIIYSNIGSLIIYSSISINYERIIFGGDGESYVSLLGRIGYGGYVVTDGYTRYTGNIGIVSAMILTGKNSGHFEGAIGYMFLQGDFNSPLHFSGGFRYQAPGKMFMYKIGGGLPELVYFGLGVSF